MDPNEIDLDLSSFTASTAAAQNEGQSSLGGGDSGEGVSGSSVLSEDVEMKSAHSTMDDGTIAQSAMDESDVSSQKTDPQKSGDDGRPMKKTERKRTKSKKKSKKNREPKIMRFRNYTPLDKGLRKLCIESEKPIDLTDHFKELRDSVRDGIDHSKHDITPKMETWDLERDIADDMAVLKYRTQLALRKLIEMKKEEESSEESEYETDSDGEEQDEVGDSDQTMN